MDAPPSSLNQTELAAWEWLVETKPYGPDEITREGRKQVPDFRCPDGNYEAKHAYEPKAGPPKIIITRRQYEALNDTSATILAFPENADEPLATFPWSEADDAEVEVQKRWQGSNTTRPPEISDRAIAKVNVLRAQLAEEIGYKPPLDRTIEAIFTEGIEDGRIPENAQDRVREELDVPETPFS